MGHMLIYIYFCYYFKYRHLLILSLEGCSNATFPPSFAPNQPSMIFIISPVYIYPSIHISISYSKKSLSASINLHCICLSKISYKRRNPFPHIQIKEKWGEKSLMLSKKMNKSCPSHHRQENCPCWHWTMSLSFANRWRSPSNSTNKFLDSYSSNGLLPSISKELGKLPLHHTLFLKCIYIYIYVVNDLYI